MPTRYDGAGWTLTNATETWDTAIRVKSFGGLKRTREVYDDTPLSEVDIAEKVFATISEFDSIEIEYFADPDSPAPFTNAPSTWVMTAPAKTGQTNGATITFTGAIIEDDTGGKAHGSRSMSRAVVMPDGKTGPTFAAGS
jgi:hypothetical protein